MKLVDYFDMYACDKGNLKHRYDRVYEPTLEPLQSLPIRILEIGVFKGASLQAWVDYLPTATFVGVDIFERVDIPNIPILNHPRVTWIQADSTKPVSEEFKQAAEGGFDVIIDDGLHTHDAQRETFEHMFPFLKKGGVYFIEDVWPFSIMSEDEKRHHWLVKHPHDWTDSKYAKLLDVIGHHDVKFHDLRSGFDPDTFIIEVRK